MYRFFLVTMLLASGCMLPDAESACRKSCDTLVKRCQLSEMTHGYADPITCQKARECVHSCNNK